jgi:hypothetical protein
MSHPAHARTAHRLHAVPTPGDRPVLLTGTAQVNSDSDEAVALGIAAPGASSPPPTQL